MAAAPMTLASPVRDRAQARPTGGAGPISDRPRRGATQGLTGWQPASGRAGWPASDLPHCQVPPRFRERFDRHHPKHDSRNCQGDRRDVSECTHHFLLPSGGPRQRPAASDIPRPRSGQRPCADARSGFRRVTVGLQQCHLLDRRPRRRPVRCQPGQYRARGPPCHAEGFPALCWLRVYPRPPNSPRRRSCCAEPATSW